MLMLKAYYSKGFGNISNNLRDITRNKLFALQKMI